MEGKASASIRIKIGQYLNKLGCVFWCKLCSITSYMLVILIMCYLSYMFFWQGRLEIFCGRGRGEKEIALLGFFSVKNQNCFTIPVTQREIKHTGDSVNILNTILKFFFKCLWWNCILRHAEAGCVFQKYPAAHLYGWFEKPQSQEWRMEGPADWNW